MVIGTSGVQFSLLSWVINKIGQLHSRRQIIIGLIMNVITDWIRHDPKPSSQQLARVMVSLTSCKLHAKSWWKFENKLTDTGSRPAGSLAEESKLATNEKLIQPVVRVGFKPTTAGLWLEWPEL